MNEEGFVSFRCPHCHTEIEASPDMIGTETECPACGQKLTVPAPASAGAVRRGDDAPPSVSSAKKSRTIRIELSEL